MLCTVDAYIGSFPKAVREILQTVRMTIKAAAPQAEETIRYRMPTFTLNGTLVHFAAFQKHIGFYPTPSAIEKFRRELAGYEGGRGSVQFPLGRPVPLDLISEIVKFRVAENLSKAGGRTKKK